MEEQLLRAIEEANVGQERIDARLIYADWLDGLGDVRGEYIRCFISRMRLDIVRPIDPEWDTLWAREQKIIREVFQKGVSFNPKHNGLQAWRNQWACLTVRGDVYRTL